MATQQQGTLQEAGMTPSSAPSPGDIYQYVRHANYSDDIYIIVGIGRTIFDEHTFSTFNLRSGCEGWEYGSNFMDPRIYRKLA